MCVGTNIRAFREAFGLSQQELADCVGVARSTVSQWEGSYGCPRMGNLHALAFVFRISPTVLITRWSPPVLEAIAQRARAGEYASLPPQALPPMVEVSSIELDGHPDDPEKGPLRGAIIFSYLLEGHPAAHSIVLNAADSNPGLVGSIDVFYDPRAKLRAGDLALVENGDHHIRFRKLQPEDLSNNVAGMPPVDVNAPHPRDVILRILGEIFWWQSSQTAFREDPE